MHAVNIFDLTSLALHLVHNKNRVEEALYELADERVDTMGETAAYAAVADCARTLTYRRAGWIGGWAREDEVLRISADMRELVGLPPVRYAGITCQDIINSFPGGRRAAKTLGIDLDGLQAWAQSLTT